MSWLRALAAAFAFLTPLPAGATAPEPRTLGRSLAFFPLVGCAIGGAQALVGYALTGVLTDMLAAVCVAALSAALSAGLHLDGLADVFDGVGGGRADRARSLEIMRDSRIGAFGAIALVLVVVGKIAALAPLLAEGAWQPVALAPVAARSAAVGLVVLFPYARPDGLGRSFHDHGGRVELLIAAASAALAVALVAAALLPALIAVWLLAAALGAWLRRRLDGLTGDVYGAAIELCELLFLIIAVAAR